MATSTWTAPKPKSLFSASQVVSANITKATPTQQAAAQGYAQGVNTSTGQSYSLTTGASGGYQPVRTSGGGSSQSAAAAQFNPTGQSSLSNVTQAAAAPIVQQNQVSIAQRQTQQQKSLITSRNTKEFYSNQSNFREGVNEVTRQPFTQVKSFGEKLSDYNPITKFNTAKKETQNQLFNFSSKLMESGRTTEQRNLGILSNIGAFGKSAVGGFIGGVAGLITPIETIKKTAVGIGKGVVSGVSMISKGQNPFYNIGQDIYNAPTSFLGRQIGYTALGFGVGKVAGATGRIGENVIASSSKNFIKVETKATNPIINVKLDNFMSGVLNQEKLNIFSSKLDINRIIYNPYKLTPIKETFKDMYGFNKIKGENNYISLPSSINKGSKFDIQIVGGVNEVLVPIKEQLKVAGTKVNAVSGAQDFYGLFKKQVTINKPVPEGGFPKGELEASFFFDPTGKLRTSRIGINQKSASPLDLFSGEFSLFKNKPQGVILEQSPVANFPKGLNPLKQPKELLKFQLEPTGQLKPLGYLSRESEVTLAPKEVLKAKGQSYVTLINPKTGKAGNIFTGRKVELFPSEIATPSNILNKALSKPINFINEIKTSRTIQKETGISYYTGKPYLDISNILISKGTSILARNVNPKITYSSSKSKTSSFAPTSYIPPRITSSSPILSATKYKPSSIPSSYIPRTYRPSGGSGGISYNPPSYPISGLPSYPVSGIPSSPPSIPMFDIPYIPPIVPVSRMPVFDGGGKSKRYKPIFRTKSKRKYTPTLYSAGFNIKGKTTKALTMSGLGIRPIIIKRSKSFKTKKSRK